MSAIVWVKLKKFHAAPVCEGACMTNRDARAVGSYRLEICGWPAGYWCTRCRKQMNKAWLDAHNPEPVEELIAA